MEDKKTFGAYVLRRRKELGMTQKAFAEKLFVTESAVSKWERGLSYPDITMLGAICEVLGVSEHELLTGSEDTQRRRAERLAERYLALTRRWRRAQYVAYGAALLGFLIGALISGNAAIFYIALPSLAMAASLTLLPMMATDHPVLGDCRASLALSGFAASLLLLLLACCFAVGGDWFFIAATGVLFGLGLFIAPVLLNQLPLPEWMRKSKTSAYLTIQIALLLLLLLACALATGGDWFPIAALGVLFGCGFFVVPVLLRQLPLAEPLRGHKLLVYFSVQTLLLFLLMCAVELPSGGARELLLLDLPEALALLALPWGDMLLGRYLPASGRLRGAACCGWSAVWMWLSPFAVNRLDGAYYGYGPMAQESLFSAFENFNLLRWDDYTAWINIYALLVFALAAAAVALVIAEIVHRKK